MRIFYPVPVEHLTKDLLISENSACLNIIIQIDDMFTGEGEHPHPEVFRWKNYPTSLYYRYQEGRKALSEQFGLEFIDLWPINFKPSLGAHVVYPQDSNEEIIDIYEAVFVSALKLEY